MIKVYIASPYSIGDKEENVRKSLEVANELMKRGYCPFAPLLSHFQNELFPQKEEKWLEMDFEWVKTCDFLLRLPGPSKGADMEVEVAERSNIPIYYDIDDFPGGLVFEDLKENNFYILTGNDIYGIEYIDKIYHMRRGEGEVDYHSYWYSHDNCMESDYEYEESIFFKLFDMNDCSEKEKELYHKLIELFPELKVVERQRKLKNF